MFTLDNSDDCDRLQFAMDRMEDVLVMELLERDEWLDRQEQSDG